MFQTIRFFHRRVGLLRLSFIRRSNLGPKFSRAAAVRLAPRPRENIQALNKQTVSQPLQPFSRRRTDCSEYFMAPDHDIALMLTSRLDVSGRGKCISLPMGVWSGLPGGCCFCFFFFPPKEKRRKKKTHWPNFNEWKPHLWKSFQVVTT